MTNEYTVEDILSLADGGRTSPTEEKLKRVV